MFTISPKSGVPNDKDSKTSGKHMDIVRALGDPPSENELPPQMALSCDLALVGLWSNYLLLVVVYYLLLLILLVTSILLIATCYCY